MVLPVLKGDNRSGPNAQPLQKPQNRPSNQIDAGTAPLAAAKKPADFFNTPDWIPALSRPVSRWPSLMIVGAILLPNASHDRPLSSPARAFTACEPAALLPADVVCAGRARIAGIRSFELICAASLA